MEITKRQQDLLERIVKEYIKKAKPVSSDLLEKKYRFGVCPATIRNDMVVLTKKGYLVQPHTSAGRIPSDKGYRFFVDKLFEKEFSDFENFLEIERQLKKELKDVFGFANRLTNLLAEISDSLIVSHLFEENLAFKQGWEKVLKEPEFENQNYTLNFAQFLEEFEKDIKTLKTEKGVKVFIGKENPFEKGKEFSMILSTFSFPKKKKGVVSIIGPKRMAYEKNINLINCLTKLLQDF